MSDETSTSNSGTTQQAPTAPVNGTVTTAQTPAPLGTNSVDSVDEQTADLSNAQAAAQPAPIVPDRHAAKFAALAKQEARARASQNELKESKAQVAEFNKFLAEVKTNPSAALAKMGLSYQDLTNFYLTQDEPQAAADPIELLRADIQAMKDAKEQETKSIEDARVEAEIQQISASVERYHDEMVTMIKNDADKYEIINITGQVGYDLVWDVVKEYWDTNKTILDPSIAAEMVEEYLLSEAQIYSSAKKLRPKSEDVPVKAKVGVTYGATKDVQRGTTLTNKTQTAVGERVISRNVNTTDDRISRAIAAMK